MENLKEIVKNSYSFKEVSEKLGYKYINGIISKKIHILLDIKKIDYSHFKGNGRQKRIYERINKTCPICGKIFETKKGHKREKITCSYSCSNVYFRSGPNNGNWKEDTYRTTCFYYHKKECIICKEKFIVEVHHFDNNHENNNHENLIPLCLTHHQYCHSRYYDLIKKKVEQYREQFIKSKASSL
jgi:hypothetical protein